jgi:hypothetical protein
MLTQWKMLLLTLRIMFEICLRPSLADVHASLIISCLRRRCGSTFNNLFSRWVFFSCALTMAEKQYAKLFS